MASFITARRTTAPMMLKNTKMSKSRLAIPNAVPAAGGCSELVIAMRSMEAPTAKARERSKIIRLSLKNDSTGARNKITEKIVPSIRAKAWPPTTDLILDVRLEGPINMPTTLDAKPAAMAAEDSE